MRKPSHRPGCRTECSYTENTAIEDTLKTKAKPAKSSLITWIGALVSLLLLGYVCYRGVREFDNVASLWQNLALWPAAGAVAFAIFMFLIFVRLSQVLVRGGNVPVSFPEMARIWFISNLFKYIPGKILMATARITMWRRLGLSAVYGTALFGVEISLLILSCMVLAVLFAPLACPIGGWWTFGIVAVILGVLIQPWTLNRVIRAALRFRGHTEAAVEITYRTELKGFALALSAWIGYGLCGWLVAYSLSPISSDKIPLFVAVVPLSWLVGLISVVAPGGLGVREASMVIGLSQAVPEPIAISVALLLRLFWLGIEAIGAGWALATHKHRDDQVRQI